MATAPLTQTTGRRKRAVARASLRPGTGQFLINGKALDVYFPTAASRMVVTEALTVTETTESYDVTASIHGGGISGQAGALRHGLARALVLADASLREVLKGSGCLTRDPRMKERKKPGQPGARKRFQFSKR